VSITSIGDQNLDWKEVERTLLTTFNLSYPLSEALSKLQEAGWIRSFYRWANETRKVTMRIYVLREDAGQRYINRHSKSLRLALEHMLSHVDVSPDSWAGYCFEREQAFDMWAWPEDSSLFYIFNTLPSPAPTSYGVKDRHSQVIVRRLIDNSQSVPGLKTPLYPYQARSAALMVQRETAPELLLDPRLEPRVAPDGQTYYYGPRDATFFKQPRLYESTKGGILAETMGLGKTLICLAVILATRHHLPQIPPQYQEQQKPRPVVGSLIDMAIAAANQRTIPLKAGLIHYQMQRGEEMGMCMKELGARPAEYLVHVIPNRNTRKPTLTPPRRLRLSSGTVVVVPQNLIHQWRSEIQKHTTEGTNALRVKVVDNAKINVPPLDELVEYDIVLFSRTRFEKEVRDGSDIQGRREAAGVKTACTCPYIRATRTRDCTCFRTDGIYSSPLKHVHWLRLIIDEGHEFSSSSSNAVVVADKLVTADRRWVVSGTPARDRLFGVEVDLLVNETAPLSESATPAPWAPHTEHKEEEYLDQVDIGTPSPDMQTLRKASLEQRRTFSSQEEVKGAARSIGLLATHFLKVRPWANSEGETKADWDDCIYRHEHIRQRTYASFSSSLRRTLEALVIKTQPDDVEKDIVLPPLKHTVVTLEPSFFDRLTANLFILFLTANAVTSERTDVDYLFHPNSRKPRYQLITNLRQSNFFWTGFTVSDVQAVIGHGSRYLEKEDTNCSAEDRASLTECLKFAHAILDIPGWTALTMTDELGLFVDAWPGDSGRAWALTDSQSDLMVGATELNQAQGHVNGQLTRDDPLEGLQAAGIAAVQRAYERKEPPNKEKPQDDGEDTLVMMGVPSSGVQSAPSAKRHSTTNSSPRKKNGQYIKPKAPSDATTQEQMKTTVPSSPKASRKRSDSSNKVKLPPDSLLRRTSIVGTASSKLTYLLGKVMLYHTDEKILIFYDGDNTAYYLAQCLELVHVKFLIYAKSLSSHTRSKYIVAFDTDATIRVLLMDIRCGALGLNVNKASRVFFINPCYRPNIEAQAIKRAHRIGQTKPVHVETLILRGTIEEAMFKRAKQMTRSEHQETNELSDDKTIARIIQSAQPMPIDWEDAAGERQMARLDVPQQIFGRDNRADVKIEGIDVDQELEPKPKRRRAAVKAKKEKGKEKAPPTRRTVHTAAMPSPSFAPPGSADGGTVGSIFGGGAA